MSGSGTTPGEASRRLLAPGLAFQMQEKTYNLKNPPQEGTRSVEQVCPLICSNKDQEFLGRLTEVFLSQSKLVKTGRGDSFFKDENTNA